MDKNLENIQGLLLKLAPEGLREIQARIAILLSGSGGAGSADAQIVYESLRVVTRELGRELLPWSILRRHQNFPEFQRGAKILLLYIDKYCQPKNQLAQEKNLNIFLTMVIRDLRARKIPLGVRPLAQGLLRTGDIVEVSFPGYRASGLLPTLAERYRIDT